MYQPDIIPDEDGKMLLVIARETLEKLAKNETIGKPKKYPDVLNKNFGVLCTIIKDGRVRGRSHSGMPYPLTSLIDAALHAIVSAAYFKGREPLPIDELRNIKIEIDILTEPQVVHARNANELTENIVQNKDGLMIRYGVYEAFLMPRDWGEKSKEEFLNQLCISAGMTKDMWKEPGCELYKFHAQIFREE